MKPFLYSAFEVYHAQYLQLIIIKLPMTNNLLKISVHSFGWNKMKTMLPEDFFHLFEHHENEITVFSFAPAPNFTIGN
jgi:hypothetical protein